MRVVLALSAAQAIGRHVARGGRQQKGVVEGRHPLGDGGSGRGQEQRVRQETVALLWRRKQQTIQSQEMILRGNFEQQNIHRNNLCTLNADFVLQLMKFD